MQLRYFLLNDWENIWDRRKFSAESLLISLQIKFTKKKEKKEKKRDRGRKISMTYLRADLNSLRWEAITEKTIIYKTTVDK